MLVKFQCACGKQVIALQDMKTAHCDACGRELPVPADSLPETKQEVSSAWRPFEVDPADTASILSFAGHQLKRGYFADEVEKQLVEQEVDPDRARAAIQSAKKAGRAETRAAGLRNMLIGCAIWLFGMIFTVLSFLVAEWAGWEKFTIAGGAIVFGMLQFLYGLIQSISGSK